MNKGIIIGIIFAIFIVAFIAVNSLNFETYDDSFVEDIVEDESTPVEEIISESENTGRDLTVELSESVGISSP